MTYKGKLYAVPQVTDMQLLVYRKSLLAGRRGAAARRPSTSCIAAAKKLTTDKVKGLFVGNDGGVGVLGGPLLWSAGLDYLTDGQTQFGFDDPAAPRRSASCATLFTSGVPAARRADRLVRPVGVHARG